MTLRRCKPKDKDPDRSAADQVWCLYTKDGSRLLGRHPTKEKDMKQERAIQISKHASTLRFASDDATTTRFVDAAESAIKSFDKYIADIHRHKSNGMVRIELSLSDEGLEYFGSTEGSVMIDMLPSGDEAKLRVYVDDGNAGRVILNVNHGHKVVRDDDATKGLMELAKKIAGGMSLGADHQYKKTASVLRNLILG